MERALAGILNSTRHLEGSHVNNQRGVFFVMTRTLQPGLSVLIQREIVQLVMTLTEGTITRFCHLTVYRPERCMRRHSSTPAFFFLIHLFMHGGMF